MKKATVSLYGALGAALLGGCVAQGNLARLEVTPVMNVRHGGAQAQGYYEMGRYYQAQNRPLPAIDAFRKALALDDRNAATRSALGIALAAQGEYALAIAEFRAAIALVPGAAHLYNNLGYALYLQGDPSAAIATFEKAAALDPANPRAWNNLGLARARVGDTALAQRAFARATDASAAPAKTPGGNHDTVAPATAGGTGTPDALAPPKDRGVIRYTAPTVAFPAAIDDLNVARSRESATERPIVVAAVPSAVPENLAVTAVEPKPLARSIETIEGAQVVAVSPHVYELKWPLAATTPATAPPPTRAAPIAQPYRLEVANGNGVTGMARRVGQMLAATGSPNARLTNHKPFAQQFTEIQYREGHATAAMTLRKVVPGKPRLVLNAALRPDTDVRIVLGKDLPANVALVVPAADVSRFAAAPSPALREAR